ncbi:Phosphatidylglycerol/phosphatidylinositol transfer protein [Apophysomyces ossiformis]|uniref:Phosphatidylglycerol/phosphatidylinositol transfer protein n=1 Tax=Apophysomyces ossiformis TaxID=679940 RepID=A0A8H7BXF1_9FUNG|nr:Phosphatidylglycerol/phosphatidylinositol transfer protein [Apophysomyces ossiformis]
MKFFASAFAIATLSALANAATLPEIKATNSVTSCGSASDLLTIDSIQYSPNPPVPGQEFTVDFKGSLSGPIPDGTTAALTIALGGVDLINQTLDFCSKLAPQLGQTCPVAAGPVNLHKSLQFPSGLRK